MWKKKIEFLFCVCIVQHRRFEVYTSLSLSLHNELEMNTKKSIRDEGKYSRKN